MKFILPEFWQLTAEQKALVAIDLDSPSRKGWWENLVVKGYWGTGKTVVVIHRILRLQRLGKKALFLCFGKSLRNFLSVPQLKRWDNLFYLDAFYGKIRDLLKNVIQKGGIPYDNGSFEMGDSVITSMGNQQALIVYKRWGEKIQEGISWYWFFASAQSKEFLEILFSRYKDTYYDGNYPYDEILIDEGQDLFPQFLEALKILTPHLSIFADENQRIGLSSAKWISIQDIAKIAFPDEPDPEALVEELTINMRSTREICTFAAEAFLPENEEVKLIQQSKNCRSIPDSIPDEVEAITLENQKEQILSRIHISQKNERSTMIFADKQQDVDKISQRLIDEKIFHGKYHNKAVSRSLYCEVSDFSQNVFVSTNISSKGLEADCVILYVTPHDEKKLSITSEWWLTGNLYYVLATRARKKLYILYTSEEK